MFPLELPIPLAALPGLAAPAEGQPQGAAPVAFDALLASLVPAAVDSEPNPEPQTGEDLPDASDEPGNPLPVVLAVPISLPLPQSLPDSLAQAPATSAAAPVRTSEPMPLQQPQPANPVDAQPDGADPAALLVPQAPVQQAASNEAVAQLTEAAPSPGRAPEVALPSLPPRDGAGMLTPAPSASAGIEPQSVQLEALVEVLAQAREAGKGARGDVAVRHAEFGLIAIRLEQDSGETRAQLLGRDPGFAPAVIAALAERSATGSADQHQSQRGSDQSWNQQPSAQSDSRQPDRRSPAPPDRDQPLRQAAHAEADDEPRPTSTRDGQSRFA